MRKYLWSTLNIVPQYALRENIREMFLDKIQQICYGNFRTSNV